MQSKQWTGLQRASRLPCRREYPVGCRFTSAWLDIF